MINTILLQTLYLLLALLGCLTLGGLMLNEPLLQQPPGFWQRLQVYLLRNEACTRRNHPFPELELRTYRVAPRRLLSQVEHAIEILGWNVVDVDEQSLTLRAEVRSRLWGFVDDIEARLQVGEHGTELHLCSRSRVGKGDLGANQHHVRLLMEALARQIS